MPEEFRDYVIAHEVVHLMYPNHGKGFKRKLKEIGVKIPTKEENLYYWYYAEEVKKILYL